MNTDSLTMENKIIIMDIETIANKELDEVYSEWKIADKVDKRLKDPFKIEEAKATAKEKFGLSPRTGQICLIGFRNNFNFNLDQTRQFTLYPVIEKKILKAAWNYLHEAMLQGAKLVTFNGKRFDLSYMIIRSLLLGVEKPEGFIPSNLMRKTFLGQETMHVDLYELLDQMDCGSLNEMTYLAGLQKEELENRGCEIQGMWDSGDTNAIKAKNAKDLELTEKLYELAKDWI